MRLFSKLGLAGILLATTLVLAACGGDMDDMEESGISETSEASEMSAMENVEDSNMDAMEETTSMESMSDMGGMEGMEGMEGMASMDMSAMLTENGEYSDERFIDLMVPHHQGAVEMAEIALDGNAERVEIKELSRNIIETQNAEIEELGDIRQEEFGTREASGDVTQEDMAMMRMMDDPEAFAAADPFDLAFIESMIPHHESAVEMSEVALENSENERIHTLAKEIIAAQEREISQMKDWREEWRPES